MAKRNSRLHSIITVNLITAVTKKNTKNNISEILKQQPALLLRIIILPAGGYLLFQLFSLECFHSLYHNKFNYTSYGVEVNIHENCNCYIYLKNVFVNCCTESWIIIDLTASTKDC